MAFSLPNPDIEFVPLDVLTAEELNQVVANINALSEQFPLRAENIASNAITNAKILDGTINANKLNWSSNAAPTAYSTTSTRISTTFVTTGELNVSAFPAGAKFVVLAEAGFNGDSSAPSVTSKLSYNGTDSPAYGVLSAWGKSNFVFYAFTKATPNYVYLYSQNDQASANVTLANSFMTAFRVA